MDNNMSTVEIDRYYMKTRDRRYSEAEAVELGIRRIYNYVSDIDFMDAEGTAIWSWGLCNPGRGEAMLVESAMKEVSGVQLYVMSCIVFYQEESCNLYFLRHKSSFNQLEGFSHLYN
jgi:hypothetical protein